MAQAHVHLYPGKQVVLIHFSVALHAAQQRMENVSLQRHLQIINPINVMITEVRTNIPVCSFVG